MNDSKKLTKPELHQDERPIMDVIRTMSINETYTRPLKKLLSTRELTYRVQDETGFKFSVIKDRVNGNCIVKREK